MEVGHNRVPTLEDLEKYKNVEIFEDFDDDLRLQNFNRRTILLLKDFKINSWRLDLDMRANDGRIVSAHRGFIEARVPEFYATIKQQIEAENCEKRYKYRGYQKNLTFVVDVPQVSGCVLFNLVNSMYHINPIMGMSFRGTLKDKPYKKLYPMAEAAHCVQFYEVRDIFLDALKEKITLDNCVDLLELAIRFNNPGLYRHSHLYMCRNLDPLLDKSNSLLRLNYAAISSLLQDDRLQTCCEVQVWFALYNWICANVDDRLQYFWRLFLRIRVCFITKQQWNEIIFPAFEILNKKTDYALHHLYTELCKQQNKEEEAALYLKPTIEYNPRISRELLFIYGGKVNGCVSDSLWILDAKQKAWYSLDIRGAPPRCLHQCVFVKENLYIIGGFNEQECLATAIMFDTRTFEFSSVENMRKARVGHSACVYNDCIYVFGGHAGLEYHATVECYYPSTDQWMFVGVMQMARAYTTVSIVDNYAYIIGGRDAFVSHNTVERFNFHTQQFDVVCSMFTPRFEHSAVVVGSEILVHGGQFRPEHPAILKFVEKYNTETDTWQRLRLMKNARASHQAAVLDNTLYIIGGTNSYGSLENVEQMYLGFDDDNSMPLNMRECHYSPDELELSEAFTSAASAVATDLSMAHIFTYYGQKWAFKVRPPLKNLTTFTHRQFAEKALEKGRKQQQEGIKQRHKQFDALNDKLTYHRLKKEKKSNKKPSFRRKLFNLFRGF